VDKPSVSGIVFLVGAGPGDPGLITVRGRRLLEQAEVVVYDYLANPKLLGYCPPGAEIIYVGKKATAHTLTQDQINQLLIDKAKPGKRVVRLKGGDPFVFGRGGEECEALRRAGIRFEVVPGITASIGGTCYAGIPVTHRDFNSSFTVITGHEKEEEYKDDRSRERESAPGSSDIDWSVIAKLPCMAFYMGVKALPRICAKLLEHGMKPDMPAATIQWGTTPRQRTVTGTISDLPQRVTEAGIAAPAITIVGRVVTLRPIMNWFETRPLFGQTIIVTRTRQQASDLSMKLGELGANVIEAPTIELAPADPARVNKALRDIQSDGYDWVIFTSANGVTAVKQALFEAGLDARALRVSGGIASIGDATTAALERHLGLRPDLVPPRAVAESLVEALAAKGQIAGKRFVLLRADIGRPIIVEQLRTKGAARVDNVAVYETRPAGGLPSSVIEAIDAGGGSLWITFTSSSTATNFTKLLGDEYRQKLANVKLASIGPITTQTLTELGLSPVVQADTFNVDGLVEAIARESSAADRSKT
jgi:uroporphyrinogen III methyltransferase / synthase